MEHGCTSLATEFRTDACMPEESFLPIFQVAKSRILLTHGVFVSPMQVSLSAFAFLFSELVQYCQIKVQNVGELERRQVGLFQTVTRTLTITSGS